MRYTVTYSISYKSSSWQLQEYELKTDCFNLDVNFSLKDQIINQLNNPLVLSVHILSVYAGVQKDLKNQFILND